jgi:chemotaxis protein methyltransferase CheR
MTGGIPVELLSDLSDLVAAQLGLHFPRERWRDLEQGLSSAAADSGSKDVGSFARDLLSAHIGKGDIALLAKHLTIGETYFFREPAAFQFLEERVLPETIDSRSKSEKRLRIWSAGCCTGEEPYSLAILLSRLIPDLQNWNITLLATDINQRFLEKASKGVYGKWSLRETPDWIVERYFRRRVGDERFEILPATRSMVTFSYLNLVEGGFPSLLTNTNAMDLILCRNVLMYLTPEQAGRVIENLGSCLVEGGWLLVSPSESFQLHSSGLVPVNYPGAAFYRKDSKRTTAEKPSPLLQRGRELWLPSSITEVIEPVAPELQLQQDLAQRELEGTREAETADAAETSYADALQAYGQGRYTEAKEELHKLLSHEPEDAESLALLGRVYANEGNLREALRFCREAIAREKLNTSYYYLLATILVEEGLAEEAMKSLKTALYLEPGFIPAHFALGNLCRRQGRLAESQKHFQNALSLLASCGPQAPLPDAEGMTACRLMEIIRSTTSGAMIP